MKNKKGRGNKKKRYYDSDSEYSDASLESQDSEDYDNQSGQVIKSRYILIKYLSYGTFSMVWLGYDTYTNTFVILKLQQPKYTEDAEEEYQVMEKICNGGNNRVIRMHSGFKDRQKGTEYFCFVLEILGSDLHSVLNKRGRLTLSETKRVIRQLLEALDYTHKSGYIHTDIKTENVLMANQQRKVSELIAYFRRRWKPEERIVELQKDLPEGYLEKTKKAQRKVKKKVKERAAKRFAESIKGELINYIVSRDYASESDSDEEEEELEPKVEDIKLSDFGGSVPKDSVPETVQSRHYRAPEVITLDHTNEKMDIWSVGCLVYELLTGESLFDPEETGDSIEADREHLQCMAEKIGKMPQDISLECELSEELFDIKGRVRGYRRVEYKSISSELKESTKLTEEEIEGVEKFIKRCCSYRVKQRPSAEELLKDTWLN